MASAQQQFSPKLRRQTAGPGSSASQVILSPFWKNLARIEQNKQQAAGTPLTLHSPGFLRRKRSGKRNSLRRVPLTGLATGIGVTLRSFGFLGNGPLRRYAVHKYSIFHVSILRTGVLDDALRRSLGGSS
ncbi:hypothetical protein B0T13DRAFT_491652 [Neurospora crassa]|nr:hypothetical protein B0T13DRAFT_492271 [Neurospora crassa]KAK3487383.1 hypothetical protein B0T13DRAFT_491652 [Neurospora crassa]